MSTEGTAAAAAVGGGEGGPEARLLSCDMQLRAYEKRVEAIKSEHGDSWLVVLGREQAKEAQERALKSGQRPLPRTTSADGGGSSVLLQILTGITRTSFSSYVATPPNPPLLLQESPRIAYVLGLSGSQPCRVVTMWRGCVRACVHQATIRRREMPWPGWCR